MLDENKITSIKENDNIAVVFDTNSYNQFSKNKSIQELIKCPKRETCLGKLILLLNNCHFHTLTYSLVHSYVVFL